ncbi:S-layer homology domain-containing protein [Cytobacillus sp. FJAT-53684]|uniref:S-layer homology domain-containing protein n=1 Tax=Cytobacillus mangrovibacter TaxID=3299024 RepID=A0ABW6K1S9_9BACI
MFKKKGARKGLAIIAALFLLMSTFLPTLPVKASTEGIPFTMEELSGYDFWGAKIRVLDSNNNLIHQEPILLQGKNIKLNVVESQTYMIEMFANFSKAGTTNEKVIYYGKKAISGSELQTGLNWTFEEDLIEIIPNFEGFDLSTNGIALLSPLKDNTNLYFYENIFTDHSTTKLLTSPSNELNAQTSGKDNDGKNYVLSFKTPQTSGEWKLAEEKAKAVQVSLVSEDENAEITSLSINLSDVYLKGLYLNGEQANIEEVFLSPGNYRMNLSSKTKDSGDQTSIGWGLQSISINQPVELTYTAYPDNMEIKNANIYESEISVETTVYGGDFQYQNSQDPDLIGKVKVADENNKIVAEGLDNSLQYFNVQTPNLEGQKYTITAEIVNAQDNKVYATASKVVDLPGRKDEDIKGTVVTAENLAGDPLKGAAVRLYEKVGQPPYVGIHEEKVAPFNLELIYNTSIQEKDGLTEAFIPNAYILDGKEYELVVENGTADNEKIVYHKSLVGGTESVVHFSKDNLSKLNITFDKEYSNQSISLAFVNHSNLSPNSWPLHLNLQTDNYIHTDSEVLLAGEFYDEKLDEAILISKQMKPVDGEDLTISLKNEPLAEITPPIGYEDAKVSAEFAWFSGRNVSKLKVNRDYINPYGDTELTIRFYVIGNDGNYYGFRHWIQELTEQIQLTIPSTFTGSAYPSSSIINGAIWVDTYYYNHEAQVELDGIYKNITATYHAGELAFNTLQEDGSIQQWNMKEKAGITVYEEQSPKPASNDGGATNYLLRYQLNKDDQVIDDQLYADNTSQIYVQVPSKDEVYQLTLAEQLFSSDVVQLEMNTPIIFGESENTWAFPSFKIVSDNQSTLINHLNVSMYQLFDYGTHANVNRVYAQVNNQMVNTEIYNLKDDDKFAITVKGELQSGTAMPTQFTNLVELSGAELKELTELNVLEDFVKVNVKRSFAKKLSQESAYIDLQLFGKDFYHTEHLFSHSSNDGDLSYYLPKGKAILRYGGINGDNAYLLSKEVTISEPTSVTFSDSDPLSAVMIKGADNQAQSFINTQLIQKGKNTMSLYHLGYNYPYQKASLKKLYVTPGEYEVYFDLMNTESNETPWGYRFLASANATENVDLQFNGFEFETEVADITTFTYEDGMTDISTQVNMKSGDLQLEQVHVYREAAKSGMGINAVDPIRDYDGDFNIQKTVNPTVKVYQTSSDKLVYQAEAQYGQRHFNFPLKAEKGQYKFVYEQPIGPKKSVSASKNFIIGQQGEFVNIQEPTNNALVNKRTITVSGQATPLKTITVEATKGGAAPTSKTAVADENGNYTAVITVPEDGKYTIQSYLADKKDVQSTAVTVEVDTTTPATPANVKAEQVKNAIAITWDKVADANKYILFAAEKGKEFKEIVLTGNSYNFQDIQPGTTYQFKVAAVDLAGNQSEPSSIKEVTTFSFAVTKLEVNANPNAYNLLSIGSDLDISMEGSYEEGFTGFAELSYLEGDQTKTKEIELVYNNDSKKYTGKLKIAEGMAKMVDIKGWIVNGSEKTEVITTAINKTVGATLKGSITEGGQPLTNNARVRLVGNYIITKDTDANGLFTFEGVPNGEYTINITYPTQNGKTFYNVLNGTVTVANGTIKQLDKAIELPANIETPPPAGGGGGGLPPIGTPEAGGNTIELTDSMLKIEGNKASFNEAEVLAAIEAADKVDKLTLKTSEKVNEFVLSPKVITVLKAKNKDAIIHVENNLGSYQLPVKEVNLQDLAKKLGAASGTNVELSITVKKSTDSLSNLNGLTLSSDAVEFSVEAAYNGKTTELNQFNQYVERTIQLPKTVDAKKAIAVKLTKNGFVPVPTTVVGKQAIIKSLSNSTYVVIQSDQTFTDVNNGASWAEEYIESLASKFIVKGMTEDKYAPSESMTRAQFTVLLVRALGLTGEAYDGRFNDVKGNEWYNENGELMAAIKYGIIQGVGNGSFAPNDTITREQAAVMIARTLELEFVTVDQKIFDQSKKASDFKDHKKMADWSKESIEKIYQANIISGNTDGTFDPKGETKRDQMAKILAEMLGKLF